MSKHILYTFLLSFFLINTSYSQNDNYHKSKFFLSAGYGLAGSFFVRSYHEFAPLPNYKAFYKKRFIGVAQNAAIGINLKNHWDVRFGINFQHFTRRIKSIDTLNNVYVKTDHDIHHRNYMWFGSLTKNLEIKNQLIAIGIGLYYLRPKQQEVEVYYPSYYGNVERDFKNNRLNEVGAFTEIAYEYKFQPKVNIGIKSQFYYTISAGYPESVTVLPYIKILL